MVSRASAIRATALAFLALAAAAPAWGWSDAETAQIDRGEPAVVLAPAPGSDAIHVRAAIDIAAPAKAIWAVMTDCARAMRFVPGLKSCRVLERDPQGRWEIREHEISWVWFLPRVHSVFRTDYDPPKRLTFKRISGTLKRNEGEWRLTARADGSTQVSYDATIAASLPVPDFMVEGALKRDIATVLRRLKRECENAPATR